MNGTPIRRDAVPVQRWRNGLGETRELAREAGSGPVGFRWRASVARVDSAAPFSRFPGVDRTIVLLEGAGFHMILDGDRRHALTTPLQPFAFAGEAVVEVALAGGATADFNLMVARGQARGGVSVLQAPGRQQLGADVVLVYAHAGAVAVDDCPLIAGDAWRCTGPGALLTLAPGAAALLVHVRPAAPPPV